jgi:heat shock protein HslJ
MKRNTGITLVIVCTMLAISILALGCGEAPEEPHNDTEWEDNATPVNGDTGTGALTISNTNIEEITDTEWQWVGLSGAAPSDQLQVPDPENYYLVFLEDGTYYFRADCNTGSGSYVIVGNSLTLEPGVMTLVACPEGSLDGEYLVFLTNVTSAAIEDGQLALYLENGQSRMLFDNAGEFDRDTA